MVVDRLRAMCSECWSLFFGEKRFKLSFRSEWVRYKIYRFSPSPMAVNTSHSYHKNADRTKGMGVEYTQTAVDDRS